jgi:hypothetical protein
MIGYKLGTRQTSRVVQELARRSFPNNVTVTLDCETEFVNGTARERFVWRVKGGRAKLAGYHISSPLISP